MLKKVGVKTKMPEARGDDEDIPAPAEEMNCRAAARRRTARLPR